MREQEQLNKNYHEQDHQNDDDDHYNNTDGDECKIFVSRIPANFNETSIRYLLNLKLQQEDAVVHVDLVYSRENNDIRNNNKDDDYGEFERRTISNNADDDQNKTKEHRGFAFVSLASEELCQRALELGTIRGGPKPTSTKKSTLYIRPIVRDDADADGEHQSDKMICFLWKKFRCPYGDKCKFHHAGEGGCVVVPTTTTTDAAGEGQNNKKKRKKCFNYKKGKCKLGDQCPFSHDFVIKEDHQATKECIVIHPKDKSDSEKNCFSWKTKGKCKRYDKGKCPYRHDKAVQTAALEKRAAKTQQAASGDSSSSSKVGKVRQPLSIRVFGMNYETTESDIREFFQDCGTIVEVTFPIFEDSGRSKGYCGVLFQSPKAVAKAVEYDGYELHGRWLSIQPGKMFLKQWEEHHHEQQRQQQESQYNSKRKPSSVGYDDVAIQHEHHGRQGYGGKSYNYNKNNNNEPTTAQVGEFGQKVKRRKRHGYT